MTTDTFGNGKDAPLYPLLGFTAAVVGGAVVLRLEFATCRDDYQAGIGETRQFVMMPNAALAIGEALTERSGLAGRPVN